MHIISMKSCPFLFEQKNKCLFFKRRNINLYIFSKFQAICKKSFKILIYYKGIICYVN
jgi:hypothetical protein